MLTATKQETRTDASKPTILVVDDEPDILQAVKSVLEGVIGARVLSAGSGRDGLEILRTERVDLLMTDFKMPGMNGIEFLTQAERISPGTPALLFTAFERELVETMEGTGRVETILSKPLNPRPMLKAVERLLHKPRR